MANWFEGMCGRVAPGLCRLSVNGAIAVRTRAGYRAYDVDTGRLTNCDSFVLDVGDDYFFVVPTSKVRKGDIILSGGLPKCVVATDGDTITAINFEDATVETLLPEHHLFMGGTCLCGRIVSLFGRSGVKGKKGVNGMMKYMIFSSLLKGREGGLSGLAPLMLMGGKSDFLEGLFDEGDEDDDHNDRDDRKEA